MTELYPLLMAAGWKDGMGDVVRVSTRQRRARVSSSWSAREVDWLVRLIRASLRGDVEGMQSLARAPECGKVAQKAHLMNGRAKAFDAQAAEIDAARGIVRVTDPAARAEIKRMQSRAANRRYYIAHLKSPNSNPGDGESKRRAQSARGRYLALLAIGTAASDARRMVRDEMQISGEALGKMLHPKRLERQRAAERKRALLPRLLGSEAAE